MKYIAIVLLLCCTLFGAVNLNEINFNTVQSGTFDRNLRGWINTLNTDITNAGFDKGTGRVFYVDSGAGGSSSSTGTSPVSAVPTIQDGINLGVANRGDIVYVIQGHATTIDNGTSDAINVDVAGLTIIGLGSGDDMPQLTYDTTTDEMVVSADGVTISNLRFIAGVSEVANAIEIQAGGTNCAIIGCVFPEPTTSSWEFNVGIQMVTAGNYATIAGNTFYSADAAGCESFIDGGASVVVGYQIVGNYIYGSFDAAAIFSDQADLELLITQNSITNLESGDPCIEFTGNSTGICSFNSLAAVSIANSLDPGTFKCFENYAGDGTDSARIEPPIADSGANYIGFNSADNSAATTSVVANANGSVVERLEYVQVQVDGGSALIPGRTYALSSSTTFAASPDTMYTVAGGRIIITGLFAELAADAAGSPGTLQVSNNATAGAAWDRTFSTAVNVDAWAQGDLLKFTNLIDQGVLNFTANVGAGQTLSWMASPGLIEQLLGSTGSGGPIAWYMTFIPLESGVTVTGE
jgi:hypothetical protein